MVAGMSGFSIPANLARLNDLEGASFEELEALYPWVLSSGTAEQKQTLAQGGYLDQCSYLVYDMACGKVSYADMEYMLLLVERASRLLDERLSDQEETIRYHMMMDCFRRGDFAQATLLAQQCLDLNAETLLLQPQDAVDVHNQDALVHFALFEYDLAQPQYHAQKVSEAILLAAHCDPQETRWDIYLEVLFLNSPVLAKWQQVERVAFERIALQYRIEQPGFSFVITQALGELMERKGALCNSVVAIYDTWLEHAYAAPIFKANYFQIEELARLFEREAERKTRVDFVDKAIENLHRLHGVQDDKGFVLRRLVQCLETKASIQMKLGEQQQANSSIDLALHDCHIHAADLEKDFASELFYAEFLYRCRVKGWGSIPPSLEQIERLAHSARVKGAGYHAAATMLLVELCLLQGQEALAMFYLTQEFLLHELCLDERIKCLQESLPPRFKVLGHLLDEFMTFEADVRSHYYFDPQFRWADVETMSHSEAAEQWSKRMAEIRARVY